LDLQSGPLGARASPKAQHAALVLIATAVPFVLVLLPQCISDTQQELKSLTWWDDTGDDHDAVQDQLEPVTLLILHKPKHAGLYVQVQQHGPPQPAQTATHVEQNHVCCPDLK
jgi:hypothetical protein